MSQVQRPDSHLALATHSDGMPSHGRLALVMRMLLRGLTTNCMIMVLKMMMMMMLMTMMMMMMMMKVMMVNYDNRNKGVEGGTEKQ